jgi:hypothetical protein
MVCLGMAAVAAVVSRQHWWAAVAVMGGGVVAGASYRMIVSSAEAIVQALMPAAGADSGSPGRPGLALSILKLVGRYALLALLAYVMIARLRLPPLGLLAGASSVVAAVALEAVRLLNPKVRI